MVSDSSDHAKEASSVAYQKVLVAVDVAAETDNIVTKAKEVAGDAPVSIVHVLEPAYFYYGLEPGIGAIPDNLEQELLAQAEAALKDIGGQFDIPEDRQYLERGHAPTQVLRLAEDQGFDLIVLGSHGRHGLRLLLGSTANAVLHGSKCDVLAVRVTE
jgi:universal stress protein A